MLETFKIQGSVLQGRKTFLKKTEGQKAKEEEGSFFLSVTRELAEKRLFVSSETEMNRKMQRHLVEILNSLQTALAAQKEVSGERKIVVMLNFNTRI